MSETIKQIMEKYNVSFEEALEIMARQDYVMSWFFNSYHPYGKTRH